MASERLELMEVRSEEDLKVETLDRLEESSSKRNPENRGGKLVAEEVSVSALQESRNHRISAKPSLQPSPMGGEYAQQNQSMLKTTHVFGMQNTS
jgi:hypothetical protein